MNKYKKRRNLKLLMLNKRQIIRLKHKQIQLKNNFCKDNKN